MALTRVDQRLGIEYIQADVWIRDSAVVVGPEARALQVEMLHAVILGPSSSISHAAVKVITSAGCVIAWTSADRARLAAVANATTSSSTVLAERQALIVSTKRLRIVAARDMLELRFGHRPPDYATENQLRGWEGVRVRDAYAALAARYGIEWSGRVTDSDNFGAMDWPNRLISQCTPLLYAAVEIALISFRVNPDLGLLHCGKPRSLVYDLADHYKLDVIIEPAFAAIAEDRADICSVQASVREAIDANVWTTIHRLTTSIFGTSP